MEKLISRQQLAELAQQWRQQGKRVVFANGCFDLLHVGHIRYLRAAKQQGDVLVVGLNSDRSVRELKGAGRPILPQPDRLELVGSLAPVDYMVVFDEPTAASILAELRPHIHCKGTDYTVENVPEREVVLAYGGETRIVGNAKAHSTRELICSLVRKHFHGE